MSAPFAREVLALPDNISELTDAVLDYLGEAGVDARAAHHVAMSLEELLTNLGTHGNAAGSPANVRVTVGPDRVTSEIVDTGPPFDIRKAADPALDQSIAERPIGGLGLFLVRKFASEIGYDRRDGANRTTFTILRNAVS